MTTHVKYDVLTIIDRGHNLIDMSCVQYKSGIHQLYGDNNENYTKLRFLQHHGIQCHILCLKVE